MKPKNQHAVETKHATPQPTAAPMTTTTQQAAEQNPAPTTDQAAEPTPAYAFGTFIKTRPALQEIADLTGETFDAIKRPNSDGWAYTRALLKLGNLPEPPPLPEIAFIKRSIDPLIQQLSNPDLTTEQRREIQHRILEIKDAPFAPIHEHREKIERLQKLAADAVSDFEEWITTDPAGIAARAADEAHSEWIKADQERRDAEAKEAEKQARIEKIRTERKQEAADLADEIGTALADTKLDHPDLDGQTLKDFIDWQVENDHAWNSDQRTLNAVLTGPPGVGKSRALAAAALAECEEWGRDNVEWITGYEFAELVSNLSTDKRDEANARLQSITQTTTLYFDDLGSANFTTARTSRFFRLIDERYRRKLPTFISTNYSTPQLKKVFTATGDSKDEAVRILRRIIGTPSEPLAKFFHFKRPQEIAKAA